jgi:hypothetical protein
MTKLPKDVEERFDKIMRDSLIIAIARKQGLGVTAFKRKIKQFLAQELERAKQ